VNGPPAGRTAVQPDLASGDGPRGPGLAWEIDPLLRGEDGRSRQVFRTRLPEAYAYFDGHFPAYPVLAAAVQLHELVLPCVRRSRADLGALRSLKGLKFLERIGHGAGLEVLLDWAEGAPEIDFEILADGVRASAGTLVLDRTGDAEPA